MLKHYTINRLLVLLVSFAFAFLAVDTLNEHWTIFYKELWAYIPVIFSIIGAAVGGYAFFKWNESAIKAFQIVLLASILVSAAGMYFHLKEEDDEEVATEETTAKEKPPLASLSFAGVAVVGMLGTLRKWEAEVVNK